MTRYNSRLNRTTRSTTVATKARNEHENKNENDQQTEEQTTDDLAALRAQRKLLDAQIKMAQAAAPAQSRLERVIAKQQQISGEYIYGSLAGQICARIDAGQDRDDAFREVVEYWTARTQEEVERRLHR